MIQNIKISFNLLLVMLLTVMISNTIPELPIVEEIVEVEEVEELEGQIESFFYQSYTQLIGAGNDGMTYSSLNLLSENNQFKKKVLIKNNLLSIGEHPLQSIPFFIRYCSLIVYS